MGFNTTAPPRTTKLQDNPTLLFSWWCTGFAMAFIAVRLCGRMVRNNQLFKEDKIMFLSVIPLLIRMAFIHVVLIWGTNNVDLSGGFTPLEIKQRTIGSKLVLPARIFYAMYIWMAKLTISEFLKRLTSTYWKRSYEVMLKGIRWFLLLTFIAVVIATLAECHPFDHYWQVIPDPGPSCRMGYAQLITMGTADMMTDALLVIFPVSLVARSPAFQLKRKLKLIALFSLSICLMVVTGMRVKYVIAHNSRQQYRTVWASGEILGAAAVTNAIVIGSFLRDRGVKKQKYKYNSTTDSMDRPSRRPTRSIGMTDSDDDDLDLFSDMCYRTEHGPESPITPRPAPMAVVSPRTRRDSILKVPGSYFPEVRDDATRASEESDIKTAVEAPLRTPTQPDTSAQQSPRRHRTVSFCDVGGLLEDASSQSSTLAPSSPQTGTRDFAVLNGPSTRRGSDVIASPPPARRGSEALNSPPPVRRGSHALLSGIGGFLSPILQGQRRGSGDDLKRTKSNDFGNDFELTHASGALAPIVEPSVKPVAPIQLRRHGSRSSLQDVGGLLGPPTGGIPPLPDIALHPPPTTNSPNRTPSPTNFSRPRPQSSSPLASPLAA
ncbi:uncharacterized protein PV09_01610 [Verruconis gallopava]|uniref:Rhodopsin domain-containing protein n=1 Tax=Verruconis gallopava TaxID=253628 RepID=A0A0D2AMH0_9PEZI|nr:uncharacterized protein PV09_01610 [Verruconis gallopava]KIW07670.1 hypothetical protein PV09_01610 [Verruconis gallopava]